FEYDTSSRHLPKFPLPAGTVAEERLLSVAAAGLDRLVASGSVPAGGHTVDEYADRLARELEVIGAMGFCDYFLIVADYVAAARSAGIRVGPGRGSACGSLVAFCAGITDVDPVAYGLYFERFLNPDRVSMPDIDVDFDSARRDEVIEYVRNKYGAGRVAHIVSYGTFAPKAALRDACRVCGVSQELADRAVSQLPSDAEGLDGMMKDGRLDPILSLGREVADAVSVAARIEGFPRNLSVHAAGIVITDGSGGDGGEIPLFLSGGEAVTQYDMNDLAELGFLKFDFLALRYLTVIDEAEKSAKREIPGFDPDAAGLSDPDAYRVISSGYTLGIFQLEKGGITSLVKRMRPACLEDLVAAIALYRPGPVDSIPKYLEGRRDPGRIGYPHPLLREVLEPTFGCVVYQEQVISIFRVLAGYTAGHADLVRRAMSKKDRGALEKEKGEFIRGAGEKGMEENAAADLFDSLVSFSGYAFNRSHAVAYGMITYRTALLKAKAPAHYYAALLGSWGTDRIGEIVSEASRLGVTLTPPAVTLSEAGFSA
ncbi:MAG: DNA polymerase III subunit alpha, partial [Clostridia bacterium]|nr:DNA polymerase III subunit alpha [Clostridia bacterium]